MSVYIWNENDHLLKPVRNLDQLLTHCGLSCFIISSRDVLSFLFQVFCVLTNYLNEAESSLRS
jgi:hypothetical protein